jgi:hypothetical protein
MSKNIVTKKVLKAKFKDNFLSTLGVDVEVYVLEDGKAMIRQTNLTAFLGLKSEGGSALNRMINGKIIGSFIDNELRKKLDFPFTFCLPDSAKEVKGYDATVLIDLCNVIKKVNDQDKLVTRQEPLYINANIIVDASAKYGIYRLIYDLVGYNPNKEEAIKLYSQFLRDEARQYEKEFPEEYYKQFYRLYGINYEQRKLEKKNHPLFFAGLTREYVYQPLASSKGYILEMLDEKNPIVQFKNTKGRRFRFHQFLEEIHGIQLLRQHIWQLVGVMKNSPNKERFKQNFQQVFGKQDYFDFEDI